MSARDRISDTAQRNFRMIGHPRVKIFTNFMVSQLFNKVKIVDALLCSPNCPFVLFVGIKSRSIAKSLRGLSATSRDLGMFPIEKTETRCYNYFDILCLFSSEKGVWYGQELRRYGSILLPQISNELSDQSRTTIENKGDVPSYEIRYRSKYPSFISQYILIFPNNSPISKLFNHIIPCSFI